MVAHESLILGTAGHIDHGKSSLIKALTGTDPDRLIEEKKRGITIELGFAQLILPSGRTLGVVDVPGHERFVRQMVSGATGIDIALLVIAADDGIMPQTVEHLSVLQLLHVKTCVVALTKADIVDEEWLAFIEEEVRTALADTPYSNAPIVTTSVKTGQGLEELKATLDTVAQSTSHNKQDTHMRLPVDRVFTIKGAGTVITGTLWSGSVSIGDEIEVLPSGLRSRVRDIQIHDTHHDSALAGNRVALNLPDLKTEQIRPGDFLATPNTCTPSDRFDARFTYADPFKTGKPFKSGTRVHVAHGTKEVIGRVLINNGIEAINPSDCPLVQIRLEEPLPVSLQDGFIVRSYSPVHVIGGGIVLDAHPRRRTTLSNTETTLLTALEQEDFPAACQAQLELYQYPCTAKQLSRDTGISQHIVESWIEAEQAKRHIQLVGEAGLYLWTPAHIQRFASSIERELLQFHSQNPEATGMPKEALRKRYNPDMNPAIFDSLLQEAQHANKAIQSQGEVSHPQASAGAKAKEREAANTLYALLRQQDNAPHPLPELAKEACLSQDLAERAARKLLTEKRAVRLDAQTYYAAPTIERYKEAIAAYIHEHGPAKAADLKNAMGISRKYAIPLLEYFDEIRFTVRNGDERSLA